MTALVRLESSNGVARITLNRPERLNAFAADMREQLLAALDTVAGTREARALTITGAGRAFCAGGDVAHMAELVERGAPFEDLRPLLDLGARIVARLDALPIPTLAVVNGAAAGAGLNLALACDLRMASDRATFGETFVRIGLHPDWGGTHHLPRIVGVARALEMCWLGDLIDAAEALRIGLVNRVVAHDRLADEAQALAERLAAAPAASVRHAKRNSRLAPGRTLAESLGAEVEAQRACWASEDVREGLRAFVEKRPPRFVGAGDRSGRGAEDGALEPAPSSAARRFE